MLFNVSGLMQEGIGATRRHDFEGVLRSDGRPPEPVRGHIDLLRTKAGVLVRAQLSVDEKETCSRCLQPLEDTVAVEFAEEFLATFDAQTGQPLAERPAYDAFVIDSNHMLDLTEAVRQYREASVAIAPLCRPDCRGLCPQCGADLNAGDCGCKVDEIDERLVALAALLKEEDEGEATAPAETNHRRSGTGSEGRRRSLAKSTVKRRKE